MGEMRVPSSAYYGAQTARAIENFPISGLRFPPSFIRMLGLVKWVASRVNGELGVIDPSVSNAIGEAAKEVAANKLDEHFPVDIFQTGSGTSTNMNANEVIANRAAEISRKKKYQTRKIHPNDHVNHGQSSNDVIPTTIHLAAIDSIVHRLLPALRHLHRALSEKSQEFAAVIKIGRTHLQDATPIGLGQEFSGYARQIQLSIARVEHVIPVLGELAIGGTAVGTGLNTHPTFARRVIARLVSETGFPLTEARNHFEAQGAQDALVEASGAMKTVAVSLTKIANDLRWLGSGPRCGLGEIRLPETQPGSSIMPGKVNPVICESVLQVAAQVIGNDLSVTIGGQASIFELATMMPVMGHNLLQSIDLLATSSENLASRCIEGIEADEERCRALIEQSLAMCTSLAPEIGYDAAAALAKEAYRTGKTVREVALGRKVLPKGRLDQLLDPTKMTKPSGKAKRGNRHPNTRRRS
jgi:fumarate hydratase class II